MNHFKISFLSVFLLILLTNNINCKEDKTVNEEDKTVNKEDKTVNEEDKTVNEEDKTVNEEDKIGDDELYDEISQKFLSLLNEDLRLKIMKNKAANEGLLDKDKFKREHLTKEELEQVQAALAQAMQPLFGQFVKELADNDKDIHPELAGPKITLRKKKVDQDKKEEETKIEEEEMHVNGTDKKSSKTEKVLKQEKKTVDKKEEEKAKKKPAKGDDKKKGTGKAEKKGAGKTDKTKKSEKEEL